MIIFACVRTSSWKLFFRWIWYKCRTSSKVKTILIRIRISAQLNVVFWGSVSFHAFAIFFLSSDDCWSVVQVSVTFSLGWIYLIISWFMKPKDTQTHSFQVLFIIRFPIIRKMFAFNSLFQSSTNYRSSFPSIFM